MSEARLLAWGNGLCRGWSSPRFYQEVVEPLLYRHCDDLPHTAALIGPGSEVLGFDTERSTGHNWGPRLQIFLSKTDCHEHGKKILTVLAECLPKAFLGYATNLVPIGDASQLTAGHVQHGVVVTSLDNWLVSHFGFDPRAGVTTRDWLAIPTQALAEFTAGEVFRDGLGQLEPTRERLAWYPRGVPRSSCLGVGRFDERRSVIFGVSRR